MKGQVVLIISGCAKIINQISHLCNKLSNKHQNWIFEKNHKYKSYNVRHDIKFTRVDELKLKTENY